MQINSDKQNRLERISIPWRIPADHTVNSYKAVESRLTYYQIIVGIGDFFTLCQNTDASPVEDNTGIYDIAAIPKDQAESPRS